MARMHRLQVSCSALVLGFIGCHRFKNAPGLLSAEGFRYSAGSAIVGAAHDTLRIAVVVVNESNQQRVIGFPWCPPIYNPLKARVSARRRAWDSEPYEQRKDPMPRDSTGKPSRACLAMLPVMSFPPGGSHTYVLNVPVREVLGDSLPAGRYRVTARLYI